MHEQTTSSNKEVEKVPSVEEVEIPYATDEEIDEAYEEEFAEFDKEIVDRRKKEHHYEDGEEEGYESVEAVPAEENEVLDSDGDNDTPDAEEDNHELSLEERIKLLEEQNSLLQNTVANQKKFLDRRESDLGSIRKSIAELEKKKEDIYRLVERKQSRGEDISAEELAGYKVELRDIEEGIKVHEGREIIINNETIFRENVEQYDGLVDDMAKIIEYDLNNSKHTFTKAQIDEYIQSFRRQPAAIMDAGTLVQLGKRTYMTRHNANLQRKIDLLEEQIKKLKGSGKKVVQEVNKEFKRVKTLGKGEGNKSPETSNSKNTKQIASMTDSELEAELRNLGMDD